MHKAVWGKCLQVSAQRPDAQTQTRVQCKLASGRKKIGRPPFCLLNREKGITSSCKGVAEHISSSKTNPLSIKKGPDLDTFSQNFTKGPDRAKHLNSHSQHARMPLQDPRIHRRTSIHSTSRQPISAIRSWHQREHRGPPVNRRSHRFSPADTPHSVSGGSTTSCVC